VGCHLRLPWPCAHLGHDRGVSRTRGSSPGAGGMKLKALCADCCIRPPLTQVTQYSHGSIDLLGIQIDAAINGG
jgi:hypothetical protein